MMIRILMMGLVVCAAFCGTSAHAGNTNTNCQVSSEELENFWKHKPKAEEDKPVFYKDEKTSVGFNDNGDPTVATRF